MRMVVELRCGCNNPPPPPPPQPEPVGGQGN